jgi:hypothetical protein
MPLEVIERPLYDTTISPDQDFGGIGHDTGREETPGDAPPSFGRCPVCNKPLQPRCRVTGAPKAPPVGTGYESRAKCGGCGTVIVYLGNYEWRPLQPSDLDEADHEAASMDKFLGGGP